MGFPTVSDLIKDYNDSLKRREDARMKMYESKKIMKDSSESIKTCLNGIAAYLEQCIECIKDIIKEKPEFLKNGYVINDEFYEYSEPLETFISKKEIPILIGYYVMSFEMHDNYYDALHSLDSTESMETQILQTTEELLHRYYLFDNINELLGRVVYKSMPYYEPEKDTPTHTQSTSSNTHTQSPVNNTSTPAQDKQAPVNNTSTPAQEPKNVQQNIKRSRGSLITCEGKYRLPPPLIASPDTK